jgi:hypothetical protein
MAVDKINRLTRVLTKQQAQIAADAKTDSYGCGQKTKSTGYMYITAVTLLKTTSTDNQLQESWDFVVLGLIS